MLRRKSCVRYDDLCSSRTVTNRTIGVKIGGLGHHIWEIPEEFAIRLAKVGPAVQRRGDITDSGADISLLSIFLYTLDGPGTLVDMLFAPKNFLDYNFSKDW